MVKVNCKLVKWEEVINWCRELALKIIKSGWMPDIIVAIARGGYVPARLLCDFLYLNDLVSIQVSHWGKAAEITGEATVRHPLNEDFTGKKVLIVDDIADTGDSIILAKKYIEKHCNPAEVKVATMQWISKVCKIKPDYYVDEVKEWIWYQYPWTRLEDTTQFIQKMLSEEGKEKREWTLDEIIEKFKEWYGIDVGRKYYEMALDILEKEGFIVKETHNGQVIYKVKGGEGT
ncbi:MAG: phosphoribosyltransferase [Thermoprotei archaeon]|nr:MAG: phosphoribosyltransferase [Thermoprotei archaeon]